MLAIGSPVTTPDGKPGVLIARDGVLYTIHSDGANDNIQVFTVLLADGEVQFYTREALASFGSDEEIRRSGSLK